MTTFSRIKTLQVLGLLSVLVLASPAFAQVQVPGAADAGRAGNTVPTPDFDGTVAPRIDIPEIRVENAPQGAENIRLVLKDVVLEGVTVYKKSELESLYKDMIGKNISLNDVYGIAQAVTRKYRKDGYLITQAVIPQQTIESGIVRIRVVEGYIDSVILENKDGSPLANDLAALADNLKKSRPLKASDLERWLLLVNDTPGVQARTVIRPSASAVGGADVIIVHDVDPYEFSLSTDNYGSRFLGPWQFSGAAQFNNIGGFGDKLEAQYVTTADTNELKYGYIGYDFPINSVGTRWKFDVSSSDTEPGYTLDNFDVRGYSLLYGTELTHPFIRSRTQNLFTTLRFDYRDLSSKNVVDADTVEDRIASIRAGLEYSLFDTIWNAAVNEASFKVSQGLNAFGASDKSDANLTRANGDPRYTKAELELSRLQTITSEVNFLVGFNSQISNDPLLTSEEFGVGGREYGRGYDSSEIVGDNGIAGKAELQWSPEVNIPYTKNNQLYGFYDAGKVWNKDEIVSSQKEFSVASTGVGVRTEIGDRVKGDFVAAFPLTRQPQTQDDKDARFYFSLSTNF